LSQENSSVNGPFLQFLINTFDRKLHVLRHPFQCF
jgi:hypothetical protein